MRRVRWVLVATAVLYAGSFGCESSSDDADAGQDVVQHQDVTLDPGSQDDPGTVDPGPFDPGNQDPGTVDPGPFDPGVSQDSGTPVCPTALFGGPQCFEIAGCKLACPGDEAFHDACLALGNEDGLAAFNAMMTCIQEAPNCDMYFNGEEPSECALAECDTEMEACLPSGTGTCRDIWDCRKKCDPEDPGCPLRCLVVGSQDERATWVLYQRCVFQGDCASTDVLPNGWPTQICENDIANLYCTNQYQACFPPL